MTERFQSDTSDTNAGRASYCAKTKAKRRFMPFASTGRTPFMIYHYSGSIEDSCCVACFSWPHVCFARIRATHNQRLDQRIRSRQIRGCHSRRTRRS